MKSEKIDVKEVIKKAQSMGLIRSYDEFCLTSEAKEYAVSENEARYYRSLNAKNYHIGDIVFVDKYFYKNGHVGYNHIFVLISENSLVDITYFGFLISSNLEKIKYKYNILFNKNEVNNLDKNSIVKCDEIFFIYDVYIRNKIGKVSKKQLQYFIDRYNEYLNDKNVNNKNNDLV